MEFLSAAVFSPSFDEVREVIEDSENLSNTRGGIVHQAAYASSGTIIGGMLAGPFGALIGGFAGAIIGFAKVTSYSTIFSALGKMAEEEQKQVTTKLYRFFSDGLFKRLTRSAADVTSSMTTYVTTTTESIAWAFAGNVTSAAETIMYAPITVSGLVYRTTTSMTKKVGSAVYQRAVKKLD